MILVDNPDDWTLYSYGNANALFKYRGSSSIFKAKLLRLRLAKPKANFVSAMDTYEFSKKWCRLTFEDELIQMQAVELADGFLGKLGLLSCSIMTNETHGILMDNVLDSVTSSVRLSRNCFFHVTDPGKSSQFVVLELKPKWLYENRRRYCRNCTRAKLRGEARLFCPIDLVAPGMAETVVEDIFRDLPYDSFSSAQVDLSTVKTNLIEYLKTKHNVFQKLMMHQNKHSDLDLLVEMTDDYHLLGHILFEMALRDVGLFLIINMEEIGKFTGSQVRAILFDVDLKPSSKLHYWVKTAATILSVSEAVDPHWRVCPQFSLNSKQIFSNDFE